MGCVYSAQNDRNATNLGNPGDYREEDAEATTAAFASRQGLGSRVTVSVWCKDLRYSRGFTMLSAPIRTVVLSVCTWTVLVKYGSVSYICSGVVNISITGSLHIIVRRKYYSATPKLHR